MQGRPLPILDLKGTVSKNHRLDRDHWGMQELLEWFHRVQRPFPWRENRSAYRVWVSEVMLQQTRASVVVPYFERWMEQFPEVSVLALASVEEVIKLWEGLGYYSRARNLHAGAQQVMRSFGGRIPSSYRELRSIRGIGSYTAGAILSFAFHQRAAAVDGNVQRVLARYFLIEEEVCKVSTKRLLEQKALACLDPQTPWVSAEALIELGALICTPRPQCGSCPLEQGCQARLYQKMDLPLKRSRRELTILHREVFVIRSKGAFLVQKGASGRLMADLYEFPYREKPDSISLQEALLYLQKRFDLNISFKQRHSPLAHSFTRYKAYLYPLEFEADIDRPVPGYEWVPTEQLLALPFSAGHRKLLGTLLGGKTG